jgi:hypothetical protein
MLQPAPAEQDFFWDDLLESIEERRVIPGVVAELLTVPERFRSLRWTRVPGGEPTPEFVECRSAPDEC